MAFVDSAVCICIQPNVFIVFKCVAAQTSWSPDELFGQAGSFPLGRWRRRYSVPRL